MTSNAPFAPGTEPLTKIKFLSRLIFTTSIFFTVTLSVPICPGNFWPLKTRAASVAPIEPTDLKYSFWPWVLGPPEKLCLLIAPANPFPLDIPTISTLSPSLKTSTFTSAPDEYLLESLTLNSLICFISFTLYLLRWLAMGLETFFLFYFLKT